MAGSAAAYVPKKMPFSIKEIGGDRVFDNRTATEIKISARMQYMDKKTRAIVGAALENPSPEIKEAMGK